MENGSPGVVPDPKSRPVGDRAHIEPTDIIAAPL